MLAGLLLGGEPVAELTKHADKRLSILCTGNRPATIDDVCGNRRDTHFGGLIEIIDSCKSSVAVQPGDEIFSLVQVGFTIFYVTPYGQE